MRSEPWYRKLVFFLAVLVLITLVAAPARDARAFLINTSTEIRLGREVAEKLEQEYGVFELGGEQGEALKRLTGRMAGVSDRQELTYQFRILDTDTVNAYAVPGGFVYLTRGLLQYVGSTDELAGVIGHEIGHISARHGVNMMQINMGIRLFFYLLFGGRDQRVQIVGGIMNLLFERGYSREQELEADRLGILYASRAGYSPRGLIDFLKRLQGEEDGRQFFLNDLLSTHPPTEDRIQAGERYILENRELFDAQYEDRIPVVEILDLSSETERFEYISCSGGGSGWEAISEMIWVRSLKNVVRSCFWMEPWGRCWSIRGWIFVGVQRCTASQSQISWSGSTGIIWRPVLI